MTDGIIPKLLRSNESSVRFKVLVNVLGRGLDTTEVKKVHKEIRSSERVKLLLSQTDEDGRIRLHPYSKWCGAHWVLACLADIGYPAGDESLIPLREQVCGWLLSKSHQRGIKTIDGRVRRCASQEGNALFSFLRLGLADGRADELAERLMKWQWPDGGWNCDKRPEAKHSSFWESLIPLRALALYARVSGSTRAEAAAVHAAEIFLKRRLYKRQRNGQVMSEDFVELHYPCYWRYDILFGLKVMAEAGFIGDERCADALDLLESKRLPDGGFPAEGKYYKVTEKKRTGRSLVEWGEVSKKRMSEFVTADALYVLSESGRLLLA